jgi:hypothetical protein
MYGKQKPLCSSVPVTPSWWGRRAGRRPESAAHEIPARRQPGPLADRVAQAQQRSPRQRSRGGSSPARRLPGSGPCRLPGKARPSRPRTSPAGLPRRVLPAGSRRACLASGHGNGASPRLSAKSHGSLRAGVQAWAPGILTGAERRRRAAAGGGVGGGDVRGDGLRAGRSAPGSGRGVPGTGRAGWGCWCRSQPRGSASSAGTGAASSPARGRGGRRGGARLPRKSGQAPAYGSFRADPGWTAAETTLKEAGLLSSDTGPHRAHVSDEVKFSLRYCDDTHITRELGEDPPPGSARPAL